MPDEETRDEAALAVWEDEGGSVRSASRQAIVTLDDRSGFALCGTLTGPASTSSTSAAQETSDDSERRRGTHWALAPASR
jgi:hypothetical protein